MTKLVDFGEMFPDYKASTGHSGTDESDPTASGRWDWIHFNTIQLLPRRPVLHLHIRQRLRLREDDRPQDMTRRPDDRIPAAAGASRDAADANAPMPLL